MSNSFSGIPLPVKMQKDEKDLCCHQNNRKSRDKPNIPTNEELWTQRNLKLLKLSQDFRAKNRRLLRLETV